MRSQDHPNREFEGREQPLPASIARTPGDQVNAGNASRAARVTPLGEPEIAFDVRSVFDSRPINAFDFNIAVTSPGSEAAAATQNCTFTAPEGYVLVLRRIHHFTTPLLNVLRGEVLASLVQNAALVLRNVDIPVGSFSDDLLHFFQLYDEGQIVGVRFVYDAGITPPDSSTAHFYGNLLPKTGRALPFEIANPKDACLDTSSTVSQALSARDAPPLLAPPLQPSTAPASRAGPRVRLPPAPKRGLMTARDPTQGGR